MGQRSQELGTIEVHVYTSTYGAAKTGIRYNWGTCVPQLMGKRRQELDTCEPKFVGACCGLGWTIYFDSQECQERRRSLHKPLNSPILVFWNESPTYLETGRVPGQVGGHPEHTHTPYIIACSGMLNFYNKVFIKASWCYMFWQDNVSHTPVFIRKIKPASLQHSGKIGKTSCQYLLFYTFIQCNQFYRVLLPLPE